MNLSRLHLDQFLAQPKHVGSQHTWASQDVFEARARRPDSTNKLLIRFRLRAEFRERFNSRTEVVSF